MLSGALPSVRFLTIVGAVVLMLLPLVLIACTVEPDTEARTAQPRLPRLSHPRRFRHPSPPSPPHQRPPLHQNQRLN